MALIDDVKLSMRITTDDFDDEINNLILACQKDLNIGGVEVPNELDDIVILAIKTYCKMNFGNPENYDKLKASYDEQKAQLSMATGYTKWSSVNG